jgi:S-DNA-T family DNA segregation ATPase FtsK/SpoIIIE
MAAGARVARRARGTRKIDTELRAKRAPVKIEPPAGAVVEKSDRAKREQQIPLFHVGDGTGIPPLALLDDPKPQQKGYSEETLETSRARSNSSSRISASTRRWSAPIRAR